MKKLRQLWGCFNGTGITSTNYKDHLYGRNMEWISVKDKTPSQNGNYLAYWCDKNTNSSFIGECLYQKSHGFTFVRNRNLVTHWMPLPPKPKE